MCYRKFAVFALALTPTFVAATSLHVPSDPKATYTILARDTSGNERTITTKRVARVEHPILAASTTAQIAQ